MKRGLEEEGYSVDLASTGGKCGTTMNIMPVDSPNQNYRILAVYSLTKVQLTQILAETAHPVSFSSKSKQFTLDLKPYINQDVIEGLEIWIYGRTALSDPDSYDIQVITQSKSNMIDVMAAYKQALLIAIPVTIVLAGILGYFLVKRMLKPVEDITRIAQNLEDKDLDRRINVRTDDELGRLAGTLNQAFERLHNSFDRERRFSPSFP
jgi:methyl-accepting chemotaxis protein